MLALNLIPVTFKYIKTAFISKVLDDFHIDNLECKTTALNFYSKLKCLTSNIYLNSVKVQCLNHIPTVTLTDHLRIGMRT